MRKQIILVVCTMLCSIFAIAQTKVVTGKVVSASTGEPIVGASVLVKGTKIGAKTDAKGEFTLNVPETAKTIIVSNVDMKTVEMEIKPNLVVSLVSSGEELGEVVVTGMQRLDKRLFTGATSKLDADNVRIAGLADVSRSLEGRVAGVSVQNVSGTFGTAPKIRVRGATSIYGDSKPLWVVDGVIQEDVTNVGADQLSSGDAITLISSAIAGLNADDIESFQILKDGSATSIYGARAMSGVIVITTKKGTPGRNTISYNGEFTMRLKPNYNNFNIMNSQEQMGVYKDMESGGWLNMAETYRAANSGVYGKMYRLMNTYDPATGQFALQNTPEAKNAYLREAEFRNTDWFDILFNTNVSQNHAVSFQSGTEKASYYTSLSYLTDPGWTKQSGVKRYTANFNANYNIIKGLKLNLISNASYRKQKAPGTLSQSTDVVFGEVKRDFDINPYSFALNTSRALAENEFYTRNWSPFNIKHELDNNFIDLDVMDVRFQGELKYKLNRNFDFAILGAYKYSSTFQQHQIKDFSNQALAYRSMDDATIRDANTWLYEDPDNVLSLPQTVLPYGGFLKETKYSLNSYDFRATVAYQNTFKGKHIVNLFGGTEINAQDRKNSFNNGVGLQYDFGSQPLYSYLYFKQLQEENGKYFGISVTQNRNAAFFANGTYSFDRKYIFNGTIRYEGSNRLGKSRKARWLPTWNISGAWNMHEENFFTEFSKATKISHLTLKASYSLTADRGPSNVTNSKVVIKSYNPWRPFANLQESGLQIDDLENSQLTYEKKHELNFGVDVGLLKNRINISFDWFKRNNYDLIGKIQTMGVGGQISKLANVATMKSNGMEFSISSENLKLKKFSWSSSFIFSKAKTEVTKFESFARAIDLISGTGFTTVGYPVRSLFSYQFKGLTNVGLPTFLNEDGIITSTDIYFQESEKLTNLVYEGPAEPPITGSFGNIFNYDRFRLNVFMTYSFGNVIRLDPVFKYRYYDLTAFPKDFINRWTVSGDENKTNIPVIADTRLYHETTYLERAYNTYNYSDVRIAKGDFVRMKEISLSYDLPKNLIKRLMLSDLSLKLQATNLFLIYSDKKLYGQDPEFFNSGGVAVPVPKQYTLTLRATIN